MFDDAPAAEQVVLLLEQRDLDRKRVVAPDVVEVGGDHLTGRREEEDAFLVRAVAAVITRGVDGCVLARAAIADSRDQLSSGHLALGRRHLALDRVVADDLAEAHHVDIAECIGLVGSDEPLAQVRPLERVAELVLGVRLCSRLLGERVHGVLLSLLLEPGRGVPRLVATGAETECGSERHDDDGCGVPVLLRHHVVTSP